MHLRSDAMTEVAFHFNMPDKTAYLCRLLRKAAEPGCAGGGHRPARPSCVNSTPPLWSFSETDFVPHCRADSDPMVLDASPIVLGAAPARSPHHDVLLNLDAQVPPGFERFERVIEVVGLQRSGSGRLPPALEILQATRLYPAAP